MRSWLLILAACGSTTPLELADVDAPAAPQLDAPPAPAGELAVQALGVQGFVLTYGDDTVLTAPLFTRQSTFEIGLNLPITSDTAEIEAGLAGVPVANVRAIVSGHAHYDHFLDVPHVMELAPGATTYTNVTGRNILAALAPDRPAGCTNSPSPVIPRARVVALDDALASHVDYTNCPGQAPAGAPLAGSWVAVPGGHVRVMALCSMHPDQLGPIHFGAGSIDRELCELPSAASGWLEGQTLAFLIDFLAADGTPAFRIFYQDAPTNAPIGQVPAAILAERTVDVALLCVGSNDSVDDEPTAILDNLHPRYALSGHWEDFFQPRTSPPQPIPLLDVDTYVARAEAALPGAADGPFVIDGAPSAVRHVLVQPGSRLIVPPAP